MGYYGRGVVHGVVLIPKCIYRNFYRLWVLLASGDRRRQLDSLSFPHASISAGGWGGAERQNNQKKQSGWIDLIKEEGKWTVHLAWNLETQLNGAFVARLGHL